jgi:signal transduction histidine kinase/ActR/RegA family two-component response regulator
MQPIPGQTEGDAVPQPVSESSFEELASAKKQAADATRDLAEANRYLEETGALAQELAARAAALAHSKNEFLANMTHEIRTPLNGILGMLDLAMYDPLGPQQRECLAFARTSALALQNLASDVLDYARCEAGKLTLASTDFSLRALLQETVGPLAEAGAKKNVAVDWSADAVLPDAMLGDPERLAQILRNLAGNAVKFTRQGKVSVQVSGAVHEHTTVELCFSITDTGIGIQSEKHSVIFQPFVQADGSTSRPFGGAGLGLPIAKSLAKLMGGTVSLESVSGRGSKFQFSAILKRSVPSEPRRPAVSKSKKHILVAEDNIVNQHLATRLLEREGHQVEVAASGKQALEMLEQCHEFDMVLMDIQMPEMDGLEAAEHIRRKERGSGHHIPIFAVTAQASESDRQRCFEAGMDGYITKPVRIPELMHMIDSVFHEVHL